MSQGQLSGIIYLENNLTTHAFTEERLEVLNMLSAQMAISLENALLYNSLERKVAERTAALNESNSKLQERNKKITDSIRYAQTIQNAILPTHTQLSGAFEEYFLLHRAKDIVSGDFYWLNYTDEAVFVAVADCTGHGVPGAFMSMIGESLLDDILGTKGVTDPAQMLENLHIGIRTGLKQEETDNDDGMDVCLCAIRPEGEGFKVAFAGAKRPLHYVKEGKLHTIKGDHATIGGFLNHKKAVHFTTHEIILQKGDMIFLSTDGYADQANIEGKKLGTPLMLQLLESNAHLPMAKQEEILQNILNLHAEGAEQRDDITLLGIRM
jgi:serine phosphatase RsbU (regulator of sigma subunit)